MKHLLLIFSLFTSVYTQAQNLYNYDISFKGSCSLEKVMSTYDENGNAVVAYQCAVQHSQGKADIYRIIITSFKDKISDLSGFIKSLSDEYSRLGGKTSYVYLKNKKGVQYDENVVIEGIRVKQRTTTIFYNNRSYGLVCLSNSSSFDYVNKKFLDGISIK